MARWQPGYTRMHGGTVVYGPIGSGGGIEQLTARTIDFAGSDAPLTSDQAKACDGCVLVPWALAATTISYNVPGLSEPLRLNGPVIAEMYLGRITRWDDPQLRRLNPGVHLPPTPVHPTFRSDSSGDTYAFTDFLSHTSPSWRSKVGGASTSVAWPTGAGARGNAGMAAEIETNRGAVGYVAIAQAVSAKLRYASVQNRAGAFVRPSTRTVAAAAETARFRQDNSASIVDPPASATSAYPISTFTYAIVRRGSSKLEALKQFVRYAVTTGQRYAPALEFAPLPANVVLEDKAILDGL
jgi:phosphate ABC transporter phosphate-binding protein